MNAFTQKPDLSKFVSAAKRSAHNSVSGLRAAANPTHEGKPINLAGLVAKQKKARAQK